MGEQYTSDAGWGIAPWEVARSGQDAPGSHLLSFLVIDDLSVYKMNKCLSSRQRKKRRHTATGYNFHFQGSCQVLCGCRIFRELSQLNCEFCVAQLRQALFNAPQVTCTIVDEYCPVGQLNCHSAREEGPVNFSVSTNKRRISSLCVRYSPCSLTSLSFLPCCFPLSSLDPEFLDCLIDFGRPILRTSYSILCT